MTNHVLEQWAVIPATGCGHRMLADRPKQYLPLGGKTILEQTLDRLLSYPSLKGVVLVLSEHDEHWESLNYQHSKPLLRCNGGEHRFQSVYNGLMMLSQALQHNALVLIHDAVRPFVLHTDLDRLLEAARCSDDGAILATPVADTLKLADGEQKIQQTQPREKLWRALTPQVFQLDIILSALKQVIEQALPVTDDASAMELAGYKPALIPGDGRNIKITHPEDLALAELLLSLKMG
jgi:2-C-methyl-D-erythritol 4-phosphate cytidylyltransferase